MKGWETPPEFVEALNKAVVRDVKTMFGDLSDTRPEPTPAELAGLLASPAELARGLAGAFDSPSMHQFDSWTDKDLYRAIAGEPHEPREGDIAHVERPDCAGCVAVAEYVAELNARGAARAAQARLEADVNAKYGIPFAVPAVEGRDGIFLADEA